MNTRYGFGKTIVSSFDAAIEKVTEELPEEGFGMLTDIDVAAILEKDSPSLARRALEAEASIAADTRSWRSLDSRAVKARTQQMQANREKIHQARYPAEQQRLMREHMQQMLETMPMKGNERHDKSMCCGR